MNDLRRNVGYILYCHKENWKDNFKIPNIIGTGTLLKYDSEKLILLLENNNFFKAIRVGPKSNGKTKGFEKRDKIGQFITIDDEIDPISFTSGGKPVIEELDEAYNNFLNICREERLNRYARRLFA